MKRLRFLPTQTSPILTKPHLLTTGLIVGLLGMYAAIFFVTKPLVFSYAGESCVPQLLIAPDIQQSSVVDGFTVEVKDSVRVGDTSLFSTKLCVTPTESPVVGVHAFTVSPFGGLVYAKQLAVEVPEAPVVTVDIPKGTKIPVNYPLVFPISGDDTVHEYAVQAGDSTALCSVDVGEVLCDIPSLKLGHGNEYTLTIERSLGGSSEVVGTAEVVTVDPVSIIESPVQNEYIVYTAPTEFRFVTDKAVKSATARFTSGDEAIPLTTTYDGASFALHLASALPRETSFTLEIEEIEAADGGILPEPIQYTFSTSGGPKVQSVSVGASNAGQNERIRITFDQPIVDTAVIADYVSVEGASARVERVSAQQIVITLQNAALCAPVTFTVHEALQSASNGWYSDETWVYTTRVACGYSEVVGYSVQGRPIMAHYFGSGEKVVLFTGGIHGSEPSSTTTMQAWADYLYSNGYVLPANTKVVIVPSVNPDGIAANTRNNAHNINLARNFPSANWKADIETASGILPGGGGTAPGSEPEAAALIALTRALQPRLEVSFHAQGSLVGANKYSDSVALGELYAKTVGYKTMFYNAEAVMGYSITGEYEEWMGEELGTPAILIELPSYTGNYLLSQQVALLKVISL